MLALHQVRQLVYRSVKMADPTILSFRLRDANGINASTPLFAIYNGLTTTVDSLIGDWLAMGALLDDASNALVVDGAVTIPLKGAAANPAWKQAPVDENDVSDIIALNYGNDITSKVWAFIIPAFKSAMLADGKVVLTQADLAALIAGIAANFSTGQFSNASGQNLTDLVNAFQSDRKRKGTVARSRTFPA